ncbi:hypothetical protein DFH11DRAFT_1549077 [Phellopilus nigrolimitatus]|nr:hypothetical protein DFH11DRAFT_1549077 [Phellopilus nigrolimitatus]
MSQLTGIDEHPTGSGGFSSVFKCEVHGKEKAIKLAQREFNLWFPLKHPYILPLDGICYFQFEREIPSFVSPWQKNGTIIEYVRTRPDVDLLHMLECIAMAVGYLHDNDIIHMDLRGASFITNILLSDQTRHPYDTLFQSCSRRFKVPQTKVYRAFNALCAQFLFRKFKLHLRDMRFGGRPSCMPWDSELVTERLTVLDRKGAWLRELTLFDAQSGNSTWKHAKEVLPKLFVDDLSMFDVRCVGGSPEAIIVREPREGWTPVNQVHLEGQAQDDEEQRDMNNYYRWKTYMQFGM